MKEDQKSPNQAGPPGTPAERELDSNELLGRDGHIAIRHNGIRYQLRATSSGGLILTK